MSKVYIRGLSIYLPDNFETSQDISRRSGLPVDVVEEKLGIKRKPVESHLSLSEMSLKSIQDVLQRTGLEPKTVSFLICAGSDFKDRYIWTMAPKIAHSVGLTNAVAFDLSAQCAGSLVALDVAKSLVQSGESKRGIISISTKQSYIVDYNDKASTFMYDFSDSSAAIVLDSSQGTFEVLGSSFITDGSFSDIVYSPFGESFMSDRSQWSFKLMVNDTWGWRERMGQSSKRNFIHVIEDSLRKSGLRSDDISYLAFLHTKKSFHSEILAELGLDARRSIYLDNYGHSQGVDPFLSLSLALEAQTVNSGDVVVLASAGTGWTWGASVLKAV
ncbi:3-oxoacyl-ACP synthase [Thermoplasmatales archaeon AK]|nr:3-oxoacyl-ACP synthase [Thermoplasmatales archaeon AK]